MERSPRKFTKSCQPPEIISYAVKGDLNVCASKTPLSIGECPSIAPFLENNGPRPRNLKNTNLVEYAEILLPVKFCWILFSHFREVHKISANHRPRLPSLFSDLPEKHELVRRHWLEILLPVKFCWILLSSSVEVKNVSANQIPGWSLRVKRLQNFVNVYTKCNKRNATV